MTHIEVVVLPPTDRGRLYPRYDEASGILAAESKVERPWKFGVDIDGRVIFDLDDERLLANFDFHVPRSKWKKDLSDDVSLLARPGDLVFSPETITTKSFSLPLRVSTDSGARKVKILFGDGQPDMAIALSHSCSALLFGNELVGLTARDFV